MIKKILFLIYNDCRKKLADQRIIYVKVGVVILDPKIRQLGC